jgi:glyoxylase-like metal-dependent hydrolase (beta-lactamase superfamily II)
LDKKVKNCEVLDDWSALLPRECYKNYEKIEVSEKWFDVYHLPYNVYCIYEGGHFQEVISYLICGSEKCLLLDTGMGIGNIKKVIEEITDKEIVVVNCHMHFDHVGNNYKFEDVYIYNDKDAVERLKKGYSNEELKEQADKGMMIRELPVGFCRENYSIPGCNPKTMKDGHIFNLGDRNIKVLHAPGHTKESIVLYDEANQILFTGDTFYPAALYAHFSNDFYGKSDFNEFMKTMDLLSNMAGKLKLVYCGHNEPLVEPEKLKSCAKAFHDIAEGKANYYEDEEKNKRYDFDGFSIIV